MSEIYTSADAQRLIDAATPGCWQLDDQDRPMHPTVWTPWRDPDDEHDDGSGWTVAEVCGPREAADAALIVAAPRLAASVVALHAQIEALRQESGHAHSVIGDVVLALAGQERPDDLALSVLAVVRERDVLRRDCDDLRRQVEAFRENGAAGWDVAPVRLTDGPGMSVTYRGDGTVDVAGTISAGTMTPNDAALALALAFGMDAADLPDGDDPEVAAIVGSASCVALDGEE